MKNLFKKSPLKNPKANSGSVDLYVGEGLPTFNLALGPILISGPMGSGKTRFAVNCAKSFLEQNPDGLLVGIDPLKGMYDFQYNFKNFLNLIVALNSMEKAKNILTLIKEEIEKRDEISMKLRAMPFSPILLVLEEFHCFYNFEEELLKFILKNGPKYKIFIVAIAQRIDDFRTSILDLFNFKLNFWFSSKTNKRGFTSALYDFQIDHLLDFFNRPFDSSKSPKFFNWIRFDSLMGSKDILEIINRETFDINEFNEKLKEKGIYLINRFKEKNSLKIEDISRIAKMDKGNISRILNNKSTSLSVDKVLLILNQIRDKDKNTDEFLLKLSSILGTL